MQEPGVCRPGSNCTRLWGFGRTDDKRKQILKLTKIIYMQPTRFISFLYLSLAEKLAVNSMNHESQTGSRHTLVTYIPFIFLTIYELHKHTIHEFELLQYLRPLPFPMTVTTIWHIIKIEDGSKSLLSITNTYHKPITGQTLKQKLQRQTKPIPSKLFLLPEMIYNGCQVLICCLLLSVGSWAEASDNTTPEAAVMVWYWEVIVGARGWV